MTNEKPIVFRDDELVRKTRNIKDNGQWRSEEIVYPKVGGRLRLAHEGNPEGLSIQTAIVKFEPRESAYVQARVETKQGLFQAHGYADKIRDGSRMVDSLLELAETRAIARSLRFAGYGYEYTGAEEVTHDAANREPFEAPKASPTAVVKANCAVCNDALPEHVADYCIKNLRRVPLCVPHQEAVAENLGVPLQEAQRSDIIAGIEAVKAGATFTPASDLKGKAA